MKIKIIKLKELEDALHPNNINVGFEKIEEMPAKWFEKPKVGACFYAGMFRTSAVQEIIDEQTIKTYNSIYRWEIIEGKEELNNN